MLLRRYRLAVGRYRRRRENACLRCGRAAAVVCRACGARVCNRCWRLSFETGSAMRLCIDCLAPGGAGPPRARGRAGSSEMLRAGVKILVVAVAAIATASFGKQGWPGAWAVIGTLLHPSIVLGLVPLAFLLGAIWLVLFSAVRALLKGRAGRSS